MGPFKWICKIDTASKWYFPEFFGYVQNADEGYSQDLVREDQSIGFHQEGLRGINFERNFTFTHSVNLVSNVA